ncbi:MAG: biotin synthase BioB [Verrucomicrobiota bacterium]
MSGQQIDGTQAQLSALGRRVLNGGQINRAEALFLINLESTADMIDLMSWANRIREHFRGNQIHLCSIVNAKAGGCPENCKFCAQSAFYQTESPRHGFVEPEPVAQAASEAHEHQVTALGLVAAWKGLTEGAMLDEVCDRVRELAQGGKVRADASLGMINSQRVADRLKAAGLECYGHNLESSRRFYPNICTTHTYDDRLTTLRHLKQVGIKLCSGGIIGMGETREDRCDMALDLREAGVDYIPVNILNPIPGTPFEKLPPITPMEALKTIACFRFILPDKEISVAGGRTVNLRDLQSMVFMAGASGLMVGNYLTTLNQSVEKDLQMLKDLGLKPTGYHTNEAGDAAETTISGCTSQTVATTRP